MTTTTQLKQQAKDAGVTGYYKMRKQQLIDALKKANESTQSFYDATAPSAPASYNVDDDFFTPVDTTTTTVQQPIRKRIEFVRADNTEVCFYADGRKVRVYWSTLNYKLTIHSEGRGRRGTTYPQLIRMFASLQNNVDGDVARVVKAIVRIKDMPATIKMHRHNKLVEDGKVTVSRTKENTSTTKSARGTIDPQWMQGYIEWFMSSAGQRPNGFTIRNAWMEYNEAR